MIIWCMEGEREREREREGDAVQMESFRLYI
jgi:hypothetical protein